MHLKKYKSNLKRFIIIFILILCSLYFISYKIFNSYFITIEDLQNSKAIHFFIDRIDSSLIEVKNVTSDYSNWDKTYDFIAGLNDEYIFNNFRHGTMTLDELNLDFIIFSNKANKILFSKYRDNFKINATSLEKEVFKTFNKHDDCAAIVKVNNKYIMTVKNQVYESDGKSDSNGYIYTGRVFDIDYINSISSAYSKVVFVTQQINKDYTTINKTHLKNIKLKTVHRLGHIENFIELTDINSKYLTTIQASFDRRIVKNGKNLLILLNAFITLLLGVVFYLMLRHEKTLLIQNEKLDNLVEKRTFELNNTLKKLKLKNEELYALAHMDTLTQIHNRRSFFELSKNAIKQIKKSNQPLCILMIDIDKFKNINDTYGHKIGDKVLIDFCNIINSILDKETIFGRLGGEEFAITFPNKSIDEVEKIAENIRKNIEDSTIEFNSNNVKYTASFGLASYNKKTSIDDTLHQADELLYQAKREGRNRIIRVREL